MTHPVRRREVLTRLAITAASVSAAVAGGGCATSNAAPSPAPSVPRDEWERVRAEFELSPDWKHFGGFLLASHPLRVRQAIDRHRKGLDDNPVHYLHEHEAAQEVLSGAASYMGAAASDIALVESTTMGLATLYNGLALAPGDEILTTQHDHFATHESLRLAAERTGAKVRKIALYEKGKDATAQQMVDAIARGIGPATRVVAVTWVHSCTGVKTPVTEIARAVARANQNRSADKRILTCVDGVHGFGVEGTTMPELECDFFAAGCHKWLFGPRGTGVLWAKTDNWRLLRPTIPQFGPEAYGAWMRGEPPPPTNAAMMTPGGFHSFEHRWALGEAFAFHEAIGKAKIAARIHELNRQCKEGLAKLPNVTLHTPVADDASAGIVCFDVAGMKPGDVVGRLHEKKIIATQTPYAPTYARLAPGLLNTPADVDAAVAQIRALA